VRGDIVPAAPTIRLVDHGLYRQFPPGSRQRRQFVRTDVSIKTVAAKNELVPRLHVTGEDVHLNEVAIPDGPGDDVLLLGLFCLLRSDDALLNLPIHQVVVFRQLHRAIPPDPVNATVTHLRKNEAVRLTQHRGKRRAHSALAAVELGHSVDHVRGGLDC
jgi:hypothetical protein